MKTDFESYIDTDGHEWEWVEWSQGFEASIGGMSYRMGPNDFKAFKESNMRAKVRMELAK